MSLITERRDGLVETEARPFAALADPQPEQIITRDGGLRRRAARCIDRMFELASQN